MVSEVCHDNIAFRIDCNSVWLIDGARNGEYRYSPFRGNLPNQPRLRIGIGSHIPGLGSIDGTILRNSNIVDPGGVFEADIFQRPAGFYIKTPDHGNGRGTAVGASIPVCDIKNATGNFASKRII